MGAIAAIIDPQSNAEHLSERMQSLLHTSPYRGEARIWLDAPIALGIQIPDYQDAAIAINSDWIVLLHGYIGNWSDLCSSLGIEWKNLNPAERLLQLYAKQGDRLFGQLRGEWAVLIWNRSQKNLIALRDPIGNRPLFLHRSGQKLVIATEARQILAGAGLVKKINPIAAVEHLRVYTVSLEHHFYEGVQQIRPGRIYYDGRIKGSDYWSFDQRFNISPDEAAERLREILIRAMQRVLPENTAQAGLSVSGGLDSGSLYALLQTDHFANHQVGAYGLIFPNYPRTDESIYMDALEQKGKMPIQRIRADQVSFIDFIEAYAPVLDSPWISTMYHIDLQASALKKDGRHILINGQGGDEWLGFNIQWRGKGFLDTLKNTRSLIGLKINTSGHLPLRKKIRWLIAQSIQRRFKKPRFIQRDIWSQIKKYYENKNEGWFKYLLFYHRTAFFKIVNEQFSSYLSLELRSPLKDLDLIEFAFSVEPHILQYRGYDRGLLKMANYSILPDLILSRMDKGNFSDSVLGILPDFKPEFLQNWIYFKKISEHSKNNLFITEKWIGAHHEKRD